MALSFNLHDAFSGALSSWKSHFLLHRVKCNKRLSQNQIPELQLWRPTTNDVPPPTRWFSSLTAHQLSDRFLLDLI